MLIRDNFRQQFYEIIRKDHVLLLVHNDVDALCACRILMSLFTCDDVAFSLIPIDGFESLSRSIEDHVEQTHTIVLINCGANRSLISLNIPPTLNIFIIDSRRPFDLDNVFAEQNIRILVKSAELADMHGPKAEEIYADDSESSEDEDALSGRRTLEDIERRALKRTRRQQWKKRRADILWEYYENSWYSTSSAVSMLELSHELGKASASQMWCAVVALNSQLADGLISLDAYTSVCVDRLRPFIRRYAPRDPNLLKGDDILRISFEKELSLPMYGHWSLYSSMVNSEYFVCRAQCWQQRGDSKMKILLASLGLTLAECRQVFGALSNERRRDIFAIVEKEMNANYASFTAVVGFCNRFNAGDFARALSARLEVGVGDREAFFDRFSSTMQVLRNFLEGSGEFSLLLKSIELYKSYLTTVVSQIFSAINQSQVLSTGPFFLLSVQKTDDVRLLNSRHFLFHFTQFAQKAFCAAARSKTRPVRPLITAVPMYDDHDGWLLVTGVMPLSTAYADSHLKSVLGRAFERVIEKWQGGSAVRDSFDPTVIMIRTEERSRFFDGLQAVLEAIS